MSDEMEDLRYPLGRWERPAAMDSSQVRNWIDEIQEAPAKLRSAVEGLTDHQLDTPYRAGGWTVRQVVHHVPDSHLNAYVRFRLAITEDEPTIRPYDEAAWAELDDARSGPIEVSLRLIAALHERWVRLARTISPDGLARRLYHPEQGKMRLDEVLSSYAWHGRHHIAHITRLRDRMGW
jgi:uncharacterized damage-inducible protein DinB